MDRNEVMLLVTDILKYARELERITFDPFFYTSRFFPNWVERDAMTIFTLTDKLSNLAAEHIETEY